MRLQISWVNFCFLVVGCLSLGIFASAETKHAAITVHKNLPNVLLITIDTVRADHVGCYGYSNIQTPTLDSLAHDGIVFERAISQVPLTWPSHTAILTGTYPFQNGVQDFTGQPLDPQFRSVAQAFKKNGYATGAVVSAFVLDRSFGLARGFDFYDDAFAPEEFQKKDIGLVDRKAGESVSHAISWLKANRRMPSAGRPFFLWLHLYDPHSPYDPPEPFRTKYHDHLYDGEIAYADHELGRVISWLKSEKLYSSTLIVALSDHGESLGEHGEQEHGFFVYNSTIRIPLIVKPPDGSGVRPGRVTAPVETTAVAATLLRLAGLKSEIEKQFTSPPLVGKETDDDRTAYSETFYTFNSFGWSPLHSLETQRFHYIDAPRTELYDVIADPDEKNNLAAQQSATVAVLKDKLQALLQHNPYKASADASAGMSPDAQEKLRALGYVAYHSPVSPEAVAKGVPDPKDKLDEFNTILTAEDALRAGDQTKGESLLQQVHDKDPQMYLVPFLLGEAALSQQKWAEASADFRQSLVLNPAFDQAMLALARALIFQGNVTEARRWARSAIQYNPENYRAWYQLGFIDSQTDEQAAISDYKKGIAIQANFAPLSRDLGLLQVRQGDFPEAAKNLSRAAVLGSNDATLYNSLGIAYSHIGRLRDAIDSYKHALNLSPDLAQAHLNLGYCYEQLNQKTLATREYREACRLRSELCDMIEHHSTTH